MFINFDWHEPSCSCCCVSIYPLAAMVCVCVCGSVCEKDSAHRKSIWNDRNGMRMTHDVRNQHTTAISNILTRMPMAFWRKRDNRRLLVHFSVSIVATARAHLNWNLLFIRTSAPIRRIRKCERDKGPRWPACVCVCVSVCGARTQTQERKRTKKKSPKLFVCSYCVP